MTRINLVDPKELHSKHLLGEIHELPRVFGLVRKAQARGINRYNHKEKLSIPPQYTLGKGHVTFLYDKLGYLVKRYDALCNEAIRRGYKINKINEENLLSEIDKWWQGDYSPTQEAIALNKARIAERTNPNWK